MEVLGDFGFRPVNAAQQPSRKPENKPFAMHMISFAHDDDLRNPYNETRPEIILYNSHDGKSALNYLRGRFRFICSNGIVAGDGFQSKMRHSRKTANGFETLLKETAESLPRMMQRITQHYKKQKPPPMFWILLITLQNYVGNMYTPQTNNPKQEPFLIVKPCGMF